MRLVSELLAVFRQSGARFPARWGTNWLTLGLLLAGTAAACAQSAAEPPPWKTNPICTPYTAKTKVVTDEDALWAAMKKHDVGWLGIKPFASNSIFQGDSSPGNPHAEEDNRLARLAIRCILCNPAITAPIPGLITVDQVDNMALAVMQRRELDLAEQAELDHAMDRAWANLPLNYQWLKDWEYV